MRAPWRAAAQAAALLVVLVVLSVAPARAALAPWRDTPSLDTWRKRAIYQASGVHGQGGGRVTPVAAPMHSVPRLQVWFTTPHRCCRSLPATGRYRPLCLSGPAAARTTVQRALPGPWQLLWRHVPGAHGSTGVHSRPEPGRCVAQPGGRPSIWRLPRVRLRHTAIFDFS